MIRILPLLVSLCLLRPSELFQDERLPIPDSTAQKQAKIIIQDVFKESYEKRTVEHLRAFAEELLRQGLETKNNPAMRYVLFVESQNIATKASNGEVLSGCFLERAVDTLG